MRLKFLIFSGLKPALQAMVNRCFAAVINFNQIILLFLLNTDFKWKNHLKIGWLTPGSVGGIRGAK